MPEDFDFCINCGHRGYFHKEVCLYEQDLEEIKRRIGYLPEELHPCGCRDWLSLNESEPSG